jgi:hypothetical protein
MTYRIIYGEAAAMAAATERHAALTEEFPSEHQALGRARELLETGEHHHVAVDDGAGNVLHGVRLQLKLGGFSGD